MNCTAGREHHMLRMWHSNHQGGISAPALWYCFHCGGMSHDNAHDPDPPVRRRGLRANIQTREPDSLQFAAQWAVYMQPNGDVRIKTNGQLTPDLVRSLTSALHRSSQASATMLMRLAGKDERIWYVSDHAQGQVIWRWVSLGGRSGGLVLPITPRIEVACNWCQKPIKPGTQAWRCTAPPRGSRVHQLDAMSSLRLCQGCLAAMTKVDAVAGDLLSASGTMPLLRPARALYIVR